MFEIATRSEHLNALRDELFSLTTVDPTTKRPMLTYESLQEAKFLDSFIREVLRTKGDTLSAVRKSTQDVVVAGKVVPKGITLFRHQVRNGLLMFVI